MIDKQEAMKPQARRNGGPDAGRRGGWRLAVLASAALSLGGCAAFQDATKTPEQAAAEQPAQVRAEGAKETFPTLGEVPKEPRPYTAPEDREKVMAEMAEDRSQATFTEAPPLETAAPRDPFASSLIIEGDSVTTSDQVAGLPLQTSAGGGQLAAIIFFGHGAADLDARDRSVLNDVAALYKQRGGSIRIVGHASSRTQNAPPDEHQLANFETSLERAEVVQGALVDLGVPLEVMQAEAVGDAEPVYHEFMPSGEAGNRRVEIFLEN